MSDFVRGLIGTAAPVVAVSIVGAFVPYAWSMALGLLGLGSVAAIVFLAKGKTQVASGMITGLAVGFVSLGVTCFAAASTGAIRLI